MIGTKFSDIILGNRSDNYLDGLDGDDDINGLAGNNYINAGEGNNVITFFDGDNAIESGDGIDMISGGNGNNLINSLGGSDNIFLGNGANHVNTGEGNDNITAGNGNNVISSSIGDDSIHTGSGNNFIYSGDGIDSILTGNGNNIIEAGTGNDVIQTGSGTSVINGGEGNDKITSNAAYNIITDNIGSNELNLSSGSYSYADGGSDLLSDNSVNAKLTIPFPYPIGDSDPDSVQQVNSWLKDNHDDVLTKLIKLVDEGKTASAATARVDAEAKNQYDNIDKNLKLRDDVSNKFNEAKSLIDAVEKSLDKGNTNYDDYAKDIKKANALIDEAQADLETGFGLSVEGFVSKARGAIDNVKGGIKNAVNDVVSGASELTDAIANQIVRNISIARTYFNKTRGVISNEYNKLGIDFSDFRIEKVVDLTAFGRNLGINIDFSTNYPKIHIDLDVNLRNVINTKVISSNISFGVDDYGIFKKMVDGVTSPTDFINDNFIEPAKDGLQHIYDVSVIVWNKFKDFILKPITSSVKFITDTENISPTVKSSDIQATYNKFFDDLYDKHLLKIVSNAEAGGVLAQNTSLVKIGSSSEDHAFKNGLALFTLAVDKELPEAKKILKDLITYGFDIHGEPVRIFEFTDSSPEDGKHDIGAVDRYTKNDFYSIDQFIPQLIGVHYSWLNGDAQLKSLAKEWMSKWVAVLNKYNGRLGPDIADQLLINEGNFILPFLVNKVAKEMGLPYNHQAILLNSSIALPRDLLRPLKNQIQDYVYNLLSKVKISFYEPIQRKTYDLRIPMDARNSLSSAIAVYAIGMISPSLSTAYAGGELNDKVVVKIADAINSVKINIPFTGSSVSISGITSFLNKYLNDNLFSGLDDILATMYMSADLTFIDLKHASSSNPAAVDTTAAHLGFLQGMLFREFYPNVNDLLTPLYKIADKSIRNPYWHNFQIASFNSQDAVDVLRNWPKKFNGESYLYKNNLETLLDNFDESGKQVQFTYLVLHAIGRVYGVVK